MRSTLFSQMNNDSTFPHKPVAGRLFFFSHLHIFQGVKVHSIKVKAPSDKGPKTVRIFQNLPNTLDFDKADSMVCTQDLM